MKNIFLKQDEEIISVVDRLMNSQDSQINLIIPAGAQIWQSSINLKLLKREVDTMGKQVHIMVADDMGSDMATRAGFKVVRVSDAPIEVVSDEDESGSQSGDQAVEPEPPAQLPMTDIESLPEMPQDLPESEVPLTPREPEDPTLAASKKSLSKQGSAADRDMIKSLVEEMESDRGTKSILEYLKKTDGTEAQAIAAKIAEARQQMADIVTPKKEKSKKKIFSAETFKKPFIKTQEIAKEAISKVADYEPRSAMADSAVRVEPKSRFKLPSMRLSKIVIGLIVAGVVIAGILSYMVLPSTEITVIPKKEKMTMDLSVIGSTDISQVDSSLNKIPLQKVDISQTKTQEFKASGQKQLNEKARGYITVYNEYSSADQGLVATTRFESADGKIFRIMQNVTVPGAKIEEGKIVASSIEIEVVADQPGTEYNVGPGTFTIPGFQGTPKYASFYGESKAAMSGGSTEKVTVVSQEDIDAAEGIMKEKLLDEVRRTFEDQRPDDLTIIDQSKHESIEITDQPEADTQADTFELSMEAIITALMYNANDLADLVDLNIVAEITNDKEPISETQQIKWLDPVVGEGEVEFSIYVEEDVAYKIDIEKLKDNLLGLKEVEVRKYLTSQLEIEMARVSFWPFWVKKTPDNRDKLKIIIEQN